MKRYQGTLAEYVMARRGMLGITVTQLAERSGLSKSEISSIEAGRIKLPGADKRRRLAATLGGFHAELLVNAGEITPEEIVEGANAYDPRRLAATMPFPAGTAAARVVALMREMSDAEVDVVLHHAEMLRRLTRQAQASQGGQSGQAGPSGRTRTDEAVS